MTRIGWLVVFLFLFILQVAAQTTKNIKVSARKTSLNQVLLGLRESYGIQFAFDNDLLSKYSVSINRTFQTEEEALLFLIKNLPFEVEKSGDVFLIIPVEEQNEKEKAPVFTRISGQVVEAQTYEPLPFSYILINQKPIQSDQGGYFNFVASTDSTYNLQISHLGYFIYDTIVTQSLSKQFLLMPQIERIEEIKVLSDPVEKSTLIGDKAGRMKINHQIAPILPGHGDNSVFNLLRLMPGILAAGEQSNDLLIWGSYESHSKIQFDGFTVFGLKNFNDNISVVNPFMVKNIEVMKGGYEARYGGRVGGIVDIKGKSGTLQKPTFTFNINNTTLNSLVEIPLSKKSTLLAAYRQTYYQLYDPTNITIFRGNRDSFSDNNSLLSNQFDVEPNFVFRDANLKYSYRAEKGGRFSISLYGGGDRFDYLAEGEVVNTLFFREEKERNKQFGGSFQFSRPWQNGNSTNFTASYSVFEKLADEQNRTENKRNGNSRITKNISSENNVDELTIYAEHSISLYNGHKFIVGAGGIKNQVRLSRFLKDEKVIDLNSASPRIETFIQDELPIGKIAELKTGMRFVYATELGNIYFEPRISTSIKISEAVKINASWGLYNQFIAKTTVIDSSLNYSYFWTNSDEINIPVLHSQHLVGGLSYHKNGFTFSAEGYFKTTDGITRFYNGSKRFPRDFYKGDARSKGLDIFVKKEYKRHMAWISYAISKTEEHFPFYVRDVYKLAPHHQTHEIKFAGIFNLKAFYFSANYVYGSGFERYNFETEQGTKLNQNYKRLDVALVYKFKPGKVKAELGISILNILNTDNLKYSNLQRTTIDDINLVGIYSDAVPFTPAVFLKLKL